MPTQEQNQHAENIRTDYEIRELHAELKQLRESNEREQRILREAVESLQKDRDRALLWGVLALGSAVIGMGMWIFNFILLKKP